jgi:hypothetical protein
MSYVTMGFEFAFGVVLAYWAFQVITFLVHLAWAEIEAIRASRIEERRRADLPLGHPDRLGA